MGIGFFSNKDLKKLNPAMRVALRNSIIANTTHNISGESDRAVQTFQEVGQAAFKKEEAGIGFNYLPNSNGTFKVNGAHELLRTTTCEGVFQGGKGNISDTLAGENSEMKAYNADPEARAAFDRIINNGEKEQPGDREKCIVAGVFGGEEWVSNMNPKQNLKK